MKSIINNNFGFVVSLVTDIPNDGFVLMDKINYLPNIGDCIMLNMDGEIERFKIWSRDFQLNSDGLITEAVLWCENQS